MSKTKKTMPPMRRNVLECLHPTRAMNKADISAATNCNPETLRRHLSELRIAGYLRRDWDPADARQVCYFRTAKGSTYLQKNA